MMLYAAPTSKRFSSLAREGKEVKVSCNRKTVNFGSQALYNPNRRIVTLVDGLRRLGNVRASELGDRKFEIRIKILDTHA